MRWDNLFHDLETQLDAEHAAAARDRQREQLRERISQATLADRIRALHTVSSRLACTVGVRAIECEVDSLGRDWFSGEVCVQGSQLGYAVVSVVHVTRVSMSALPAAQSAQALLESSESHATTKREGPARLVDRIPLRIVLRDLCRRRKPLTVVTAEGSFSGTLDSVGADYIELARHVAGTPRRQSLIERIELMPIGAIQMVWIEP
jgi:hypothetical protein